MNHPAQDSSSTPETTPTVLVVEDEPAIREVVADLLQDEGYAVRQAADGLQAIDELEVGRRRPSAVRCADAAP